MSGSYNETHSSKLSALDFLNDLDGDADPQGRVTPAPSAKSEASSSRCSSPGFGTYEITSALPDELSLDSSTDKPLPESSIRYASPPMFIPPPPPPLLPPAVDRGQNTSITTSMTTSITSKNEEKESDDDSTHERESGWNDWVEEDVTPELSRLDITALPRSSSPKELSFHDHDSNHELSFHSNTSQHERSIHSDSSHHELSFQSNSSYHELNAHGDQSHHKLNVHSDLTNREINSCSPRGSFLHSHSSQTFNGMENSLARDYNANKDATVHTHTTVYPLEINQDNHAEHIYADASAFGHSPDNYDNRQWDKLVNNDILHSPARKWNDVQNSWEPKSPERSADTSRLKSLRLEETYHHDDEDEEDEEDEDLFTVILSKEKSSLGKLSINVYHVRERQCYSILTQIALHDNMST